MKIQEDSAIFRHYDESNS